MNNQIIDSFFKDNKRKVICEDEFITDNMIIYIEEKKQLKVLVIIQLLMSSKKYERRRDNFTHM